MRRRGVMNNIKDIVERFTKFMLVSRIGISKYEKDERDIRIENEDFTREIDKAIHEDRQAFKERVMKQVKNESMYHTPTDEEVISLEDLQKILESEENL